MRDDEIDRILSRDEERDASPGFAFSVMDAVRREAAAPPPIPFPWSRAIPGIVAAAFMIVLAFMGEPAGNGTTLPPGFTRSMIESATSLHVDWIAVALLLTVASVMLSKRLTWSVR